MPNTLAHLGIQGVATLSWLKKADLKWIFIGCIIPDPAVDIAAADMDWFSQHRSI
jgi:hypothetical protein